MSLDAGSVYTTLGGRFQPADFQKFTAATLKAKGDMETAERGITQSHSRMASAAKVAGLAIGAAAIGGAAIFVKETIKATKVAAEFDQELRNLAARSDVTKKQLGQIRKAALDLGTSMGVGARQAAKAATELVKGGISVQKILSGGLKAALDLAVAGEMDVAQAAETMANALNAFKLPGSQAAHIADALATAANATTADVKDMAVALTQGGAAAKAAGLSFDETVAALEALALAGVKGSDAGTSLKSALTQVANPTKQAAGLMDDLGIKFFDAQGSMKPLPQIAGMLREKLGGLTKEQRLQAATTLAGTDGMRALLALYDAGPKKIEKLQRGLKEQGSAAKVAAEQNEGAAGAGRKLAAAWEQAQIIVGEQVLPALASAADTVTAKLKEMADDGSLKRMGQDIGDLTTAIAENLPAAIDQIDQLASGLGSLSDVVGEGSDILGAVDFFTKIFTPRGLFSAVSDPFGFILDGAKATVVALKEVARAVDAITPGDQSGMVKKAEETVSAIENVIGKHKHKEVSIAIGFDVNRASENEIFKLFDQLDAKGKKNIALTIIANTGSAESAIEGLKAALKGVPGKAIVNVAANAQSADEEIAGFRALVAGVPAKTVTKVQTEAKTAAAAILAFQALVAGVPVKKVTRVLAETGSARAQIAGIQTLINAIPASKTSTITIRTQQILEKVTKNLGDYTVKKRAAGRPAGGTERALIGEGAGPEWWIDPVTGTAGKTMGPMFADLGANDYIIPTEPKYRGRALGLLSDVARDLGMNGFAAGRKSKRILPAPPKDYRVGDPDDLRSDIEKLEGIADDKVQSGKLKGRLTQRAVEARAELRRYRPVYAKSKRLADAITANQERAENAYSALKLADSKGDQKGFDRELGTYKTVLGREQGQLQSIFDALRSVGREDTSYGRAVRAKLLGVKSSAQDALGLALTPPEEPEETEQQRLVREAAERLADTGMTDQERATLAGFDKDLALAALTQTLQDDRDASNAKTSFLQGILNAALVDPARGGSASIASLAGQLKQSQEFVTSGSDSSDIQAQLAQETERNAVIERGAAVDRAALAAFTGFQGAGAGGLAPTTNITVNTLHPGDPAVWTALAQTANAGNDLGIVRRASTVKVGL